MKKLKRTTFNKLENTLLIGCILNWLTFSALALDEAIKNKPFKSIEYIGIGNTLAFGCLRGYKDVYNQKIKNYGED